MVIFSFFIVGLFFGSFLNVLSDRLPRDESVVKGRSHCEKCKKTLNWNDLIPLFSFLFLKGKCRYCHTHLSYYYPLVELVTGVLFAFTYLWVVQTQFQISNIQYPISNSFLAGVSPEFFVYLKLFYTLFVVSTLIAIFFADLKFGIIPDKLTFLGIFVTAAYLLLTVPFSLLLPYLLSALGSFLFFLALFIVTRGRGMGFGDVKLAFWLGLLLGFPAIIPALYIAFLTGAAISIILIISRKAKIKHTIPFGPFLVFGTLVTFFMQGNLVQMFFSFFNLPIR